MRFTKEMKNIVFPVIFFLCAAISQAQTIRGSISKDATINTADVWFRADYNNAAGEYINYFQLSVAIPAAGNSGVTATALAVNNFQDMGTLLLDGPYTENNGAGSEIVFNFGYLNPAPPSPNNFFWNSGSDFIGVKISFTGGPFPAQIKLVDFTNAGGGLNTNTFFGLLTNTGDKTNYANLFFQIAGLNVLGTYPNGDQYVKTTDLVGLPVTLVDFNGYKDNTRNQLKWQTATEQNLRGFEIQRSYDRAHFDSIGFVKSLAPGGNSSTTLNYSFTDAYPPGLQQYYRLRLIDRDGSSRYTSLVLLRREKPVTVSIDELYPNPAHTTVNLRINAVAAGSLNMLILDMSGKKLVERKLNTTAGYNILPVSIINLPAGMYMMHIMGDGIDVLKKFVKE